MTIKFESLAPYLDTVEARPGTMHIYKNDSIVSNVIRTYGEYCHAEIDVMNIYITEGMGYIDVGVNIGYHSLAMHKQAKCNILGFEPHPTHFAVAAENCKDLPIQIYNAAASDYKGKLKITNIDLDNPENYGEVKQTSNDDTNGIEVPCVRIDDFNLGKIDGMKIDVEGFEINVMRGAENTIDKNRPVILFEALDMEWLDCFEFLDRKNYTMYWLACFNTPVKDETFIPKVEGERPFNEGGVSNIIAVPKELKQLGNLIPVRYKEKYTEAVARIKNYVVAF